jgi:hypothetical protein
MTSPSLNDLQTLHYSLSLVMHIFIHFPQSIQGRHGFESRKAQGIFLFATASRPTLGFTQSPIQWVPGALSPGVKRPGREANHWNYTSIPSHVFMVRCLVQHKIHLYGMALGYAQGLPLPQSKRPCSVTIYNNGQNDGTIHPFRCFVKQTRRCLPCRRDEIKLYT